jgi:hypothetical protein
LVNGNKATIHSLIQGRTYEFRAYVVNKNEWSGSTPPAPGELDTVTGLAYASTATPAVNCVITPEAPSLANLTVSPTLAGQQYWDANLTYIGTPAAYTLHLSYALNGTPDGNCVIANAWSNAGGGLALPTEFPDHTGALSGTYGIVNGLKKYGKIVFAFNNGLLLKMVPAAAYTMQMRFVAYNAITNQPVYGEASPTFTQEFGFAGALGWSANHMNWYAEPAPNSEYDNLNWSPNSSLAAVVRNDGSIAQPQPGGGWWEVGRTLGYWHGASTGWFYARRNDIITQGSQSILGYTHYWPRLVKRVEFGQDLCYVYEPISAWNEFRSTGSDMVRLEYTIGAGGAYEAYTKVATFIGTASQIS